MRAHHRPRRRAAAPVSRVAATTTGPMVHIGIVQIGHPGPTDESQYDAYWTDGLGSQLRSMYGALLGMIPIYIGYHKLVHADGRIPEIGFEYSPDDRRPRWPDPDHPQQVHLDIEVPDLPAAEQLVVASGARRVATFDDHVVLEDAAGHPFCLYPGAPVTTSARIVRVVFDCFSPRSLASFYEDLLDMCTRVVDTAARVEITGDGHGVTLAFQHSACDGPRWPDPRRPQQLHLDIVFEEPDGITRAERLGAIRLPRPERPDAHVHADPAGHPFCVDVGLEGRPWGPAQVAQYERWRAEQASTGEW